MIRGSESDFRVVIQGLWLSLCLCSGSVANESSRHCQHCDTENPVPQTDPAVPPTSPARPVAEGPSPKPVNGEVNPQLLGPNRAICLSTDCQVDATRDFEASVKNSNSWIQKMSQLSDLKKCIESVPEKTQTLIIGVPQNTEGIDSIDAVASAIHHKGIKSVSLAACIVAKDPQFKGFKSFEQTLSAKSGAQVSSYAMVVSKEPTHEHVHNHTDGTNEAHNHGADKKASSLSGGSEQPGPSEHSHPSVPSSPLPQTKPIGNHDEHNHTNPEGNSGPSNHGGDTGHDTHTDPGHGSEHSENHGQDPTHEHGPGGDDEHSGHHANDFYNHCRNPYQIFGSHDREDECHGLDRHGNHNVHSGHEGHAKHDSAAHSGHESHGGADHAGHGGHHGGTDHAGHGGQHGGGDHGGHGDDSHGGHDNPDSHAGHGGGHAGHGSAANPGHEQHAGNQPLPRSGIVAPYPWNSSSEPVQTPTRFSLFENTQPNTCYSCQLTPATTSKTGLDLASLLYLTSQLQDGLSNPLLTSPQQFNPMAQFSRMYQNQLYYLMMSRRFLFFNQPRIFPSFRY
ncbi:MAG: hypothetical protein HY537_06480 [Deltaproteobacteria bacterium]|nr:hypothetical protein [Deltaproteobacteria bacterium]